MDVLMDVINLYPRWTKICMSKTKARTDNKLTTKSQLLSSNRVIASAMLSIPVQACKKKKQRKSRSTAAQ